MKNIIAKAASFFGDLYIRTPASASIVTVIIITGVMCLRKQSIAHRLILHPYSIVARREHYRLLTSWLVQNDLFHLIVNAFMAYVFCSGLEESFAAAGNAPALLALVFITSVLCGNAFSTWIHRKDFTFSSCGASGGVMGCMAGYILLNPTGKLLQLPAIGPVSNILAGGLYLLLMTVFKKRAEKDNIDFGMHLVGGLAGFAVTAFISPAAVRMII